MEARSVPDELGRNLVCDCRNVGQDVCESLAHAQTSRCLEHQGQIKLSESSRQCLVSPIYAIVYIAVASSLLDNNHLS